LANPFSHALNNLQSILKRIRGILVLWLVLILAAVFAAAQFTEEIKALKTIALGTALLLMLWWLLLAWFQKSRWLLDLQDFFTENNILPFNYTRFKGNSPFNLSENQERLLRTAAGQYKALAEKTKETNQTMEKYLGAGVTDKAAKMAQQSELGGELHRVYVLFSDLRGFTSMTEALKPQETVEILNQMFTAMSEVILQQGGDINKFIGDAIFAYFRRPYGDEGEASKKVLRTALRMQERFEIINKSFTVAYSKPVDIGLGIGITAGEAIVGNLGSSNRMEYTLIGDTVNLASRFCGIAKHGQILINETMAQAAKDHFELSPQQPIEIKGKEGLQKPYLVMGERLGMTR
jgi:class 3 adenylate cyclase